MASVGQILRGERERQGLNLGYIAEQTRIRLQYLEALEKDDFESLPGRFFARSFTTQYADKLGINTPELQAALQRQVEPVELFASSSGESPPAHSEPSWRDRQFTVDPLPEGTASAVTARKLTSSVVMLAAVIIACGTVFWLWQRSQLSSTSASAPQSEVPAVPKKQEEKSPLPQVAARQTVSPPAAQPDAPAGKPEVVPGTTAQTPPVASPPPMQNLTSGRISLAVVAKEDTWVKITVDGKVVVQRVLVSGDSAVTAGNESAKILLGNAAGVDIRFNGASIGSVGPRGQVRTVDFTPEKFQVIEPQKKPPAPDNSTPQSVAENF